MNTCSPWVSSQFGEVAGSHTRGDASAPRGFHTNSRVLSRLHVSLLSPSLTVAFTGLLGHKRLQNQHWREEAKKSARVSTINYHDRECRHTANNFFLYRSSHNKCENNVVICHQQLDMWELTVIFTTNVQSSYHGLTLLYPTQQKDFSANEGPLLFYCACHLRQNKQKRKLSGQFPFFLKLKSNKALNVYSLTSIKNNNNIFSSPLLS